MDRRALEGGGTLCLDYILKTDRAMASQTWVRCFRSGYSPESWKDVRAWTTSNLAKRMVDVERKLAEEQARMPPGDESVVVIAGLEGNLRRMRCEQKTLAIQPPSRMV